MTSKLMFFFVFNLFYIVEFMREKLQKKIKSHVDLKKGKNAGTTSNLGTKQKMVLTQSNLLIFCKSNFVRKTRLKP